MGDKGHQANIHFVPSYGKLISKYVKIIVIVYSFNDKFKGPNNEI